LQRTALGTLQKREVGSRVEIWARVTDLRERKVGAGAEAHLSDESGHAWLVCDEELPPLGSLVQLTALWSADGTLLAPRFESVQPAHESFVYARSEFAATQQRAPRLQQRAQIMRMVRAHFDADGFLEVETPLVVPSPGLDVHLDAMAVQTKQGERYLITSPEYQMKRLLAGGLERIYQLCKCFRNDEVGERHQPEFTMLEWYRAFAGVDDVMRDTEQLVAQVARLLSGADAASPAMLRTAFGTVDVTPPWRRITVREALQQFCGIAMEDVVDDEERFYRLLIEQIEPRLCELGAVFLCEYPASMASLARKKPGDEAVAERFEAYVAGVELCNGFGELTDPVEQRARLLADQATRRELGYPVYPVDERFLAALEQGMPASAGNALGLDRLIMLALGAEHIEDVLALGASGL
jgi:lysyl-tRNA synthetase class 2